MGVRSRREFLLAVAAWPALAWVGAVSAQSKPPVVIGWLAMGSRQSAAGGFAALKEGLTALGWKEGANYVLEGRWADGDAKRLAAVAEELSAKKPALIVTVPRVATVAAAKAAPRIPIVQASGDSPVDLGLAASLARPGGMVTGVTNIVTEVSQKYLEFLLAAAPKLKRVGFLVNPRSLTHATNMKNARGAIEHYRIEARFAEATTAGEIDLALSRLVKEGIEGLVVMPGAGLFIAERRRIVKLTQAQRWPAITGGSSFAEDGGLLSYGADELALYHRAAHYVDRILKGARPGDLPIEQPTRFQLTVNMKTARALGLTLPPSIMVQATKVIE